MRTLESAMMIVALALCMGSAVAQPSQTSQSALSPRPSQTSQPFQPSLSAQASQPSPSAQASQPALTPQPSEVSQPPQSQYSADSLYNLANSYARAGKPGLAVLNYERAALLAPYDADIAANLEYVRTSAHVPAESPSRFARIVQFASPTSAAWLGVLGILLFGTASLAKRLTRRFRWITAGGMLVGVTLIALTVSNAMLLWPRMHEAVVLTGQTPVLVSPVPMADTAFVLLEAETVTMTARHEDFILIRTRGGLSGWVARGNLEAVVP